MRAPSPSSGVGLEGRRSSGSALVIAVRDVFGPRTGGLSLLETAVEALQSGGYRVTVANVGSSHAGQWRGADVTAIPGPTTWSLAASAGRAAVRGASLNASMFDVPAARAAVAELAFACQADVVIGDTIRAFPLLKAVGRPWLLQAQDLLSVRYADIARGSGQGSVLGYYSQRLHPWLAASIEAGGALVARLESSRARQVERRAAQRGVVALVAAAEVRQLQDLAGAHARVLRLPMAVDPVSPGLPSSRPGHVAAFLGGMGYAPNREAVAFLRDAVLPAVREQGEHIAVEVIGAASSQQRRELGGGGVTFRGYVEDLPEALRGYRMFVSPVLSGFGVKTKVLDAMSVGLPIVGTSWGVSGIDADSFALVGNSPELLAHHLVQLARNPAEADRRGRLAHRALAQSFSSDVVFPAWLEAVAQARRVAR